MVRKVDYKFKRVKKYLGTTFEDLESFSSSSICTEDERADENLAEGYKNMEKRRLMVTLEFKVRIASLIIFAIIILIL